ncbi:MAG TPA: hypothetical protein VLF91_06395 [Candidatus Saccharimonadales bacterium]|nr:hypothetical protein [Candidatus Saccharimonadales bacterium]
MRTREATHRVTDPTVVLHFAEQQSTDPGHDTELPPLSVTGPATPAILTYDTEGIDTAYAAGSDLSVSPQYHPLDDRLASADPHQGVAEPSRSSAERPGLHRRLKAAAYAGAVLLNPITLATAAVSGLRRLNHLEHPKRVRNVLLAGALGVAAAGAAVLYARHVHDPSLPDTPHQDLATHTPQVGPGLHTLTQAASEATAAALSASTRAHHVADQLRTAQAGDSLTKWSRETLFNTAMADGFSQQAATLISHNHSYVEELNQAFLDAKNAGNQAVLHDARHWMYQGHTYDPRPQTDAATRIVDALPGAHHPVRAHSGGSLPPAQTHTPAAATDTTAPTPIRVNTQALTSDMEAPLTGTQEMCDVAYGTALGIGIAAVAIVIDQSRTPLAPGYAASVKPEMRTTSLTTPGRHRDTSTAKATKAAKPARATRRPSKRTLQSRRLRAQELGRIRDKDPSMEFTRPHVVRHSAAGLLDSIPRGYGKSGGGDRNFKPRG